MEYFPLVCWFLDAGNDETVRALNWPASKKRQGTKSRAVGHWLAASYVDLMLAPISIVGRTAARRDLHVLSHARSGECDKHFGWFRSVARRAPHTDGCYWVERDAAGVEPAHGREKVASMAKICASRRSILARPILSACSLAGPRGISINPSERGEIGPGLF